MSWPETAFETLYAAPSRNGVYKPKEYHGRGVRIVNMGELFGFDFLSGQEMERVALSDSELAINALQDGDLLFGRRSLVEAGAGKCSLVVAPREDLTFESSIIRVRVNRELVNPRFLYYFFRSPEGRGRVRAIVSGTNVKGIRGTDLRKLLVPTPPRAVQDRVAAHLSTYDSLIENNHRRMALLEESARLLFREWFVALRFPGREHAPMAHGIPEGWNRSTLGASCSSLEDGDWIETKDQGGEDYRLLQISNIGINEFVETYNLRFINEETFRRLRCREVRPEQILISRMPKPIGRAWLVSEMPWKLVTAVDVAILTSNGVADPYFLIHHLNSPTALEHCERRAVGATRPRIARRELATIPVLVPPQKLQSLFREVAEPIHAQRANLFKQNEKLRVARDLLLPRVMSGEDTE